jgi:hypothetical protein
MKLEVRVDRLEKITPSSDLRVDCIVLVPLGSGKKACAFSEVKEDGSWSLFEEGELVRLGCT